MAKKSSQSRAPAAATPAVSAETNESASDKPANVAKPVKEQAESIHVPSVEERESLSSIQANFGRQRRLEKLARKDPLFAELHEAFKALQGANHGLREKLSATEAALSLAQGERTAAQEECVKLREQLSAALSDKK
ncbi:MAG TPA: hypothetical protein VEC14_14155 [Reyranellaceae bacterium]|nr:hypothetical protein [Reyranellaceae bacterium]